MKLKLRIMVLDMDAADDIEFLEADIPELSRAEVTDFIDGMSTHIDDEVKRIEEERD